MGNNKDSALRVSNLSVKLKGQTILDNVSFELKRGTTLAILGPNGSGKTMLFRTLLSLIPYTGKIEWAEDTKIGYVPQNIAVDEIPISVGEFLSFRSRVDTETSLSLVRLDNKNMAEKTLGNLSGGELRRVLIAWALTDNPNVLLFDEPTTGIDIGSEEPIFATLKKLKEKRQMTLLLITHDIHIVNEYSDHLLALNRCITFFGESKEIMKPSVQKMIYGEPFCIGTLNEER